MKTQLNQKMKYFLYIPFLLLIPLLSNGQDTLQTVVGSSGGDYENEKISLSWTIGEVVTETRESSNYILSQGFHQGNLEVTRIEEILPAEFQIKAYPNPVSDILIIESQKAGFEFQLINNKGQVLKNGIIHSTQDEIDFTELPPGNYYLQVEKHKTHKIIKH